MAQETEIKIAISDLNVMRERLKTVGATRRGERFEINAFFDTADHALKSGGNGLRLRSMRDASGQTRNVITYKGPAAGDAVRSREEIEFSIGDFDAARTLLARLGYVATIAFEKRRETWELGGCLVELDELPRLGTFLEIEGDDPRRVAQVRTTLGLDAEPAVMIGYASMVTRLMREDRHIGSALRFA